MGPTSCGEVCPEGRTCGCYSLADSNRSADGHLRVDRGLLQPAALPLRAQPSSSRRLRGGVVVVSPCHLALCCLHKRRNLTTGLAVGQRVFGLTDWHRDGTLAEYVAVEARNLAPLPGDVAFTVG